MTKIMTLDIAGPSESWRERKRRIAATIRASLPDIVALQSVRHSGNEDGGWDQASQIAVLLPEYMEVYFEPALGKDRGELEGCAVLTRGRILEAGALKLDPSTAGRRLLVHALIETSDGPLRVFNLKLPPETRSNDDALAQCLRLIESSEGARVLVGSLNSPPESHSIRELIRRGWLDAWDHLRPSCPGHTYDAASPNVRVDYVFTDRSEPAPREIRTIDERLADHLGLMATL